MSLFDKAKKDTLKEFPKLKLPFELDSNGFFFLNVLVNKITKNLVDFYNKYEILLESKDDVKKLDISDLLLATKRIYSLNYFLDKEESNITDYLDKICKSHNVLDNTLYSSGEIEKRLYYISILLMQKSGDWPIVDYYFILDGERKIPISENSQKIIKSHIFELITLLHYAIDKEKMVFNVYYTELLIALKKIKIIFTIDESF